MPFPFGASVGKGELVLDLTLIQTHHRECENATIQTAWNKGMEKHGMVKVERHFCRLSSPTPLFKAGSAAVPVFDYPQ